MRTFHIKPGSKIEARLRAVLNREDRWDAATEAIGKLLQIPDFKLLADESSRLIVSEIEVDKLSEGKRHFKKVAHGMYTPKKSTKQGKEWIEGFNEIVDDYRLDAETLSAILFELRIVNRSFFVGYKNIRCFEVSDQVYLSWTGDGSVPNSDFIELSIEEAERVQEQVATEADQHKKVKVV